MSGAINSINFSPLRAEPRGINRARIANNNQQIAHLERQVTAHAEVASTTRKIITNNTDQINITNKLIDNNERLISNYNDQINITNKLIDNNERLIDNNERLISNYNDQINITNKLIDNNERLIDNNERLIDNNERLISNYNDQINITNKLIDNNERMIANNERMIYFIDKLITALNKSRDLSLELHDITNELLDCYKKLLEIVQAKDTSAEDKKQIFQFLKDGRSKSGFAKAIQPPQVPQQQMVRIPTVQTSKSLDMAAINANATQKLGDLLFDRYKDIDLTAATNLRELFFRTLDYNATTGVSADSTSLATIFHQFNDYIINGYNAVLRAQQENYFLDLQTRLMRVDECC